MKKGQPSLRPIGQGIHPQHEHESGRRGGRCRPVYREEAGTRVDRSFFGTPMFRLTRKPLAACADRHPCYPHSAA